VLRLFVAEALAPGAAVRILAGDLHHVRVRRLGVGDAVRLVDAAGSEHEAVLEQLGQGEGVARVGARLPVRAESALDLVLVPALLRGPRMDWVVEKSTELGVQRIVPVETRHAVAHGAHLERWRRIALAASKQSGRTRVPTVDPPRPLPAALALPWPGLRLVPWERERATRLDMLAEEAAAVVVLVGPEGGLADDELAAARAHGFVAVTLGPRVLRAETAAIAIVAACQARWGDG
jgi:16S rRNA (uracil1498-N3)-methyltransferase